jgi:hypothetical protein
LLSKISHYSKYSEFRKTCWNEILIGQNFINYYFYCRNGFLKYIYIYIWHPSAKPKNGPTILRFTPFPILVENARVINRQRTSMEVGINQGVLFL